MVPVCDSATDARCKHVASRLLIVLGLDGEAVAHRRAGALRVLIL